MTDAISQLWPDHELEKAKKLYRDAVWRLRKTLRDVGFNCVTFGRANLTLIKDNIRCDMWDYVEGDRLLYNGEYLKNYEWSLIYQTVLDALGGALIGIFKTGETEFTTVMNFSIWAATSRVPISMCQSF